MFFCIIKPTSHPNDYYSDYYLNLCKNSINQSVPRSRTLSLSLVSLSFFSFYLSFLSLFLSLLSLLSLSSNVLWEVEWIIIKFVDKFSEWWRDFTGRPSLSFDLTELGHISSKFSDFQCWSCLLTIMQIQCPPQHLYSQVLRRPYRLIFIQRNPFLLKIVSYLIPPLSL